MGSKQVLVMKKFPKARNLRTGKYVAQGAHASVGALFSIGSISANGENFVIPLSDPFVKEWVIGNFRKIVCYVDTDEELLEVYSQAVNAGIASSLIKDAGNTEFDNIPTLTAVGIGPADEIEIDKISKSLSLF